MLVQKRVSEKMRQAIVYSNFLGDLKPSQNCEFRFVSLKIIRPSKLPLIKFNTIKHLRIGKI